VVEGNARLIENRWLAEQDQATRDAVAREEAEFGSAIDFSAFPQILLFEIGAPYELGQILVSSIEGDRGQRGVDEALGSPPDTSEQYLFPDIYFAGESRVEVPAPPVPQGVEFVDDGVVGALFWFGLLTTGDTTVNSVDATRAVQGWGGDWAVTYQLDGLDCVVADFVGDSQSDTEEFESAMAQWASDRDSAAVSVVDARVRVESCGPSALATPPQI
jgi:hypothetical protein